MTSSNGVVRIPCRSHHDSLLDTRGEYNGSPDVGVFVGRRIGRMVSVNAQKKIISFRGFHSRSADVSDALATMLDGTGVDIRICELTDSRALLFPVTRKSANRGAFARGIGQKLLDGFVRNIELGSNLLLRKPVDLAQRKRSSALRRQGYDGPHDLR